jgi:hypothetical protein
MKSKCQVFPLQTAKTLIKTVPSSNPEIPNNSTLMKEAYKSLETL